MMRARSRPRVARRRAVGVVLALVLSASAWVIRPAAAQQADAPDSVVVYKHVDNVDLHLSVWSASGHAPKDGHPPGAVVFYHGGAWVKGDASQFAELCKLLSGYGLVTVSVEYRLAVRNHADLKPLVEDARSAMRWVRGHAAQLKIDPDRIAAGGGSAGGHLALATALFDDTNDPLDNKSISAHPNALILFNPVYSPDELSAAMFTSDEPGNRYSAIEALKAPLPPTLIMHGTADQVVNFKFAGDFVRKAHDVGSGKVTLVPFEGRRHGFFNDRAGRNPDFVSTAQDVVDFLHGLGWISCLAGASGAPNNADPSGPAKGCQVARP